MNSHTGLLFSTVCSQICSSLGRNPTKQLSIFFCMILMLFHVCCHAVCPTVQCLTVLLFSTVCFQMFSSQGRNPTKQLFGCCRPQCQHSNSDAFPCVLSFSVPKTMQSHTDCICLTFLQVLCFFSNVLLPWKESAQTTLHLHATVPTVHFWSVNAEG